MTAGTLRTILLLGVAAAVATGAPADAKPTPLAKCQSAKLKASAKLAAAKLGCQAKAAAKLEAVDPACLQKADAALAKSFTKAESKGGCGTTGDAGAVGAVVDPFVDAVVAAEPDGGTKEGGKCASSKRKAAGKKASAKLLCHAKAAQKEVPIDPACLDKAEDAFGKAFAKAEAKGGCVAVGDAANVELVVDGVVGQVLALLTATTTTTIVPTTTTTTQPGVTVVKVGEGVLLTFNPDTVTINVGGTVRWEWFSTFHSVTSGTNGVADGAFCSPNDTNCALGVTSDQGFVYEHTFTQPGTFPYFCAPHFVLGMVGTVIVQ
jgi:plastocyanin